MSPLYIVLTSTRPRGVACQSPTSRIPVRGGWFRGLVPLVKERAGKLGRTRRPKTRTQLHGSLVVVQEPKRQEFEHTGLPHLFECLKLVLGSKIYRSERHFYVPVEPVETDGQRERPRQNRRHRRLYPGR